jgi:HD-like signal output (HDOD) protein
VQRYLGQAFPTKNWPLDPTRFGRHSLGSAMICRKFADKLAAADGDKAHMAGLPHDIGFLVNGQVFPGEFAKAVEHAVKEQISLDQAERAIMGFSH